MITKKLWWCALPLTLTLFAACADEEQGDLTDTQQASPRGKNNPPVLDDQIDRMGRPAINTALIQTFNPDTKEKDEGKDDYNEAERAEWPEFTRELEKNLGIIDGLDGVCGNQLLASDGTRTYRALAEVLIDDQIYVNTDEGECTAYLGVEAEYLELVRAGSCGGRTPEYDVIETTYSVLATGKLTGVDDTIAADDTIVLATFPFLAEPQ